MPSVAAGRPVDERDLCRSAAGRPSLCRRSRRRKRPRAKIRLGETAEQMAAIGKCKNSRWHVRNVGGLILYIGQPSWHVPLGMKHAPNVNMRLEIKIENEPRKSFESHGP